MGANNGQVEQYYSENEAAVTNLKNYQSAIDDCTKKMTNSRTKLEQYYEGDASIAFCESYDSFKANYDRIYSSFSAMMNDLNTANEQSKLNDEMLSRMNNIE